MGPARDGGCPMPSHQFRIGETVYVRPAISRNVPGGAYVVTKQLPHNGREFEYRIKSANEEARVCIFEVADQAQLPNGGAGRLGAWMSDICRAILARA